VIENKDGTFVRKVVRGEAQEVPVVVGIRGANGLVEILSGLEVGDKVENVGLKAND
jgi:hypothetical protein